MCPPLFFFCFSGSWSVSSSPYGCPFFEAPFLDLPACGSDSLHSLLRRLDLMERPNVFAPRNDLICNFFGIEYNRYNYHRAFGMFFAKFLADFLCQWEMDGASRTALKPEASFRPGLIGSLKGYIGDSQQISFAIWFKSP